MLIELQYIREKYNMFIASYGIITNDPFYITVLQLKLTKLKVRPSYPQKFHLFIDATNIFFCFILN